ncbi:MAG: DUF1559 domain-containing protein [Acidobacteriaceae bacterium]|nr:DUF1559 domain-containing protein [Acidobacteriaceae bacterium]
MKNFRHFDIIRPVLPGNPRRLAAALLLSICVGAYSQSPVATDRTAALDQTDPGAYLRGRVEVSAGGPYFAKAGEPITLHGTYTVAGQTQNSNQLKSIGQALQSYLQDHGTYPPAALLNHRGEPTLSWRVLILPYLGEKALYDRFNLEERWDKPVNRHLLRQMPDVYRKGDADWDDAAWDKTETGFAGIQGTGSLFENASAHLNGGHAVAGISQTETMAVGPVGAAVHLPWTAPRDIEIDTAAHLGSAYGFSGKGHAFTPLLFLDGSVHLMPNNVAPGSMILWTHVTAMQMSSEEGLRCACAPPSSVDAGLAAAWDLGKNATFDTQGFDVRFLASKPGRYTVTMHVFDHFGNEYNSSTKVEVREHEID